MRVLVTGATGFIGGNLARALVDRGYEVRALVRPGSRTLTIDGTGDGTGVQPVAGDILDRESVRRALQGCQGVFHCAAAYTFWSRDPAQVYRTNVEGTRVVLEAALQAGVDKAVYTSTVSTIGLPREGLGTEDTPVSPDKLAGHYKKSKHLAELVALGLAQRGLPLVVVNPTAPVGPCDVRPTPTGKVVLDFMLGRIPAYVNTGMNLVDVADVATGHILALERGQAGQRYLLGHRNVTLKEVFQMLQAVCGRRAPRFRAPFWMAMAAGYADSVAEGWLLRREPRIPLEGLRVAMHPMYVSCQKAVDNLGLPQSPVEPALERAVRWFKDNGYADQD
ncbi:MAG: NAD-dependent epimerase/dehydratase family protein [Dehalococcoidia bacterium]|nr:NAD-dependent epimerase/dehydratase family protein [Dehalococcoidia bacterium]MSQ17582.1 NAD-dependent epimerase/dehydratase family protein [Dehalococcoidia bacterium]